jgi:hypothetical protein
VVIWEQLFLRKETAMSGFVDFAEVKERCSIVDAVALLGLKTTEERNQLRAACPACGNGGPRAIVITPSKGLFHCFPSKAGGDQIALVSHVKGLSQKNAAALVLGQSAPGTIQDGIRRRDFVRFGTCISCGKTVSTWREFDAGHFISAGSGGFSLLFGEQNINGECQYDNAFNGNHLLLYRRGLDARYGKGTAEALEERCRDVHFKGTITKEWSKKEYEAKIEEIKEKLALLEV